MGKPESHSSQMTMVNVSLLNIDPDVQRKLNPGWVKGRASDFDVDKLGYIVVNRRKDGKHYVIDGQHRVALMRSVGWGDQKIHAEIFDGLGKQEEAALFRARNDRRAVRKIDDFRIAVQAGDPTATTIDKIVREHGLVISDQLRDGHIVAVNALEKIYSGARIASAKEGPRALARTITTLAASWGNQGSTFNHAVLLPMGLVFLRYGKQIDDADLAKKLGPFPGGAPGLIGKGRAMRDLRGRTLDHCVASIIVDIYNKGRRAGKVEGWES